MGGFVAELVEISPNDQQDKSRAFEWALLKRSELLCRSLVLVTNIHLVAAPHDFRHEWASMESVFVDIRLEEVKTRFEGVGLCAN